MNNRLENQAEVSSFLAQLSKERRTGEVIFRQGENSAKFYLERGFLIWAFTPKQKESFQSILSSEQQFDQEKLLEGIKAARAAGKRSIDDILVFLGIADAALRASIVERHTRATLEVISSWNGCDVQAQLSDSTPPTESPTPSISSVFEQLRMEVPLFLAVMLIDCKSGMPIASLCEKEGIDIEATSAFYRDILRSAKEALDVLEKTPGSTAEVDEVIISNPNNFVLLRSLRRGERLLFLLMDKQSNPGTAKAVVRKMLTELSSV